MESKNTHFNLLKVIWNLNEYKHRTYDLISWNAENSVFRWQQEVVIPFFVRAMAPERVPAFFCKTSVDRSILAYFKSEFSEQK